MANPNVDLTLGERVETIDRFTASRLNPFIGIHAEEVTNDARKNERLKRHECKACFYASRIGGAAMTTRPCMSCGSEEMYGSTATDVLCMDCATKHGLCKHCGGDLEMRTRRKDWPETPNAQVTGAAPTNGERSNDV